MYQILENPGMMKREEIDSTFKGKWVYLIHANFTKHNELIEAMPVIIGDCPFDGVEDGIYDDFRNSDYGVTASYTLLKNDGFIASLFL